MTSVYDAFGKFKEKFEKNESLFSVNTVFNNENMTKLLEKMCKNEDASKPSFDEKVKNHVVDNDNLELLGNLVWLWALIAADIIPQSKKKDIKKWVNFNEENLTELFPNGISSTGQFHKSNKHAEICFILSFFIKLKEEKGKQELNITNFNNFFKEYKNGPKVAMSNVLAHLLDHKHYEPCVSHNHKHSIVEYFKIFYEGRIEDKSEAYIFLTDTDKEINNIKMKIMEDERFKGVDVNNVFYSKQVRALWLDGNSILNKNAIYYGPPGTGKTYSVIESVKAMKVIDNSVQYRIVQFHPSFAYEDFIDGLKPVVVNGNVSLTLKNGVFKDFCIEAMKALIKAKESNSTPPNYYFIVDEINRAELSNVLGEVLSCLEEDKRIHFDKEGNLSGLRIETQNSYMVSAEELNEKSVIVENGKSMFGIPVNVFFIGTMNDIDRSVDTFDFALRRRFTWIRKGFDADILYEMLAEVDSENKDKYVECCKALNKYISETLELGDSFEIGHAYFGKIKSISKNSMERIFSEHLSPLLEEYLRSEYSKKEIKNKINEAKKQFTFKDKVAEDNQ
jgi:5-methylcytosine-specific restriction protein B